MNDRKLENEEEAVAAKSFGKRSTKKIGIWILAIGLFAAHLFFRSVAHADDNADSGPRWKQVYTKSGDCRIAFPSTPQMIEQSLPLGEGTERLNYDIYLAPFEDRGVFLLLVATYPSPLTGGHEVAGLEGLVKGIVSHHDDNKLIFSTVSTFFGFPALNFLVQSPASYFRGQAFMVGNKLFLIAMEGRKGDLDEIVFKRFVKSFHFSDK